MANTAKIDVAVRVRPLLEIEKMNGQRQHFLKSNSSSSEIRMIDPEGKNSKVFAFDKVCGNSCLQEEFYETIGMGKYIERVLEGYHATVFVYGQTGAGKTYTMEGLEYDLPNTRSTHRKPNKILGMKDAGLIPRVIRDMFKKISDFSKKYNRNYNVYCSFLELYNEKIYDLLNPDQLNRISAASPGLKLRWHKKDQFLVENLYVFACTTPEELEFLFQMGVRNKTMASHRLNNASSRSHCIFEIKVEFSDIKDPDDVVVSKLALVDLAGSERSSWVNNNTDGRLAKEAIEINKSLFTLRQVINAIYDSQNKGSKNEHHIPYRESKLTSLLKQSIGGNSYCLMIACLSPSDENYEENMSTLGYATKVTKIQNEPIRNDDPKWKVIQDLKTQNIDLLQKLNEANQQILSLTQNISRKGKGGTAYSNSVNNNGYGPDSASILNSEEDHYVRNKQNSLKSADIRSPTEQTGVNERIPGNYTFSPSYGEDPLKNPQNTFTDINSENMMFSENLTQQLVVAINQIRDLLEALKKERERNENLVLKLENRENGIATLMRENQELRDYIIQLESANAPDNSAIRNRTSSGPSKNYKNTYLKGVMTPSPYNPSPVEKERVTNLSSLNSSFRHVMPKIKGQTPKVWQESKNEIQEERESPRYQHQDHSNYSNYVPTQENVYQDHHYRTTTMFARNVMYRKGTGTGKGLSDTQSEFHTSFMAKNTHGMIPSDDVSAGHDRNLSMNLDTRTQTTPRRTERHEEIEKGFSQVLKDENKAKTRENMPERKGSKDVPKTQEDSKRRASNKPRATTPMDRLRGIMNGEYEISNVLGKSTKINESFKV